MKFNVITLFPKMFNGPLSESIIKRARNNKLIDIDLVQLRDYATDKHKTVDDTSYGGGAGMVLKVDVIDRSINDVKKNQKGKTRTILLTPGGNSFDQKKAIQLSKYDNLILIAGHYEGFDQRIHDYLVDEEISIGDYVLTGGELPAMIMIDAISRMVPGVIKEESALNESFMNSVPNKANKANKLSFDYPVYTKPVKYKGWKVPEVLLNGNHSKIETWRNKNKREQA
jgi:tRNA (guanine37-N1)-methyltransferase